MRHASKVAEQIQAVVPEKWHEDLDWIIKDASYKPPEQQRECFGRLSYLCNDIVGGEEPLVTDWKIKMIDILTDKEEEEMYLISRSELASLEDARKKIYDLFPDADATSLMKLTNVTNPIWVIANTRREKV